MNKRLLLLLTVCSMLNIVQKSYSQNTNYAAPDERLIPGSMTGMNMREHFTPNLFTGTMQVSVPIYSFNHDGRDFGISLSYDTKGIPVDAISSQIGLNWNLIATPSIVRIIRDLPDGIVLHEDSIISGNLPDAEHIVLGKLATYMETAQQKTIPNVYRDGEADEFIVSLNGTPFKFFIGPDNKFFTIPHRNVKIELLNYGHILQRIPGEWFESNINTDMQFRITDEQGNKFYFEPERMESRYINGFADWQQVDMDEWDMPTVSWLPKKIVFADGSMIRYEYASDNFAYDYGYSYTAYKNNFVKETRTGGSPTTGSVNDVSVVPDTHITPYLKSITYPNGITANFEYSKDTSQSCIDGVPLLEGIKLFSGNNSINYNFYHSKKMNRWFLDSLKMVNDDSSYQEPYFSFEYNQVQLPSRLNSARDFFGYYNGDSSFTPLNNSPYVKLTIPKHGIFSYGNARTYNSQFAQAGLLTKLKNAFGGEEDYYYGANTGSSVLGGILPSGDSDFLGVNALDGVRIDSIIQKDKYHPGSSKAIKFSYSNGQTFLPGGKFYYPYHIDSLTDEWDQVMYQSMFISTHEMVKGCNHGYSNVSVTTYGLNGVMLSRRDLSFTNMKDATSNNIPRYYKVAGSKDYFEYPYTDKQYLKDWEIGLPLTITDYDQNNRITQRTLNQYEFSPVDTSAKDYLINTKTARVNSGHEQLFPGMLAMTGWYPYKKTISDTYYPFTGTANLIRSITEGYVADQKKVADTTWYSYDSHNNLSSVIQGNSKGEKIGTLLDYNYNVDGPDVDFNNPGTTLYNMTDSGLEKVVSTETWKISSTSGIPFSLHDSLLNADITVFQYQNGKLWEKGDLKTDIGSPMTYIQYTGLSQGSTAHSRFGKILTAYNTTSLDTGFNRTSEVTLFDSIGDPLEIHSFGLNNYSAAVWDPKTGHRLAIVQNSRYKDIAYTGFESDYSSTGDDYGHEGNFIFNKDKVIDLPFISVNGLPNKCYQLNINDGNSLIDNTLRGIQSLTVGKPYLLSFWYNGQKPTINIGSQNIAVPDSCLITAVGNWKNVVLHLTPSVTGSFRFANSGSSAIYLDEVRLCPAEASMQSRTYAPLFGINSETDAGCHVIRYGFDKMGRKTIIRDREFHILSGKQYHIGQ